MTKMSRFVAVVELQEFARAAAKLWSEDEQTAFIDFIAAHPLAGVAMEGTRPKNGKRRNSYGH